MAGTLTHTHEYAEYSQVELRYALQQYTHIHIVSVFGYMLWSPNEVSVSVNSNRRHNGPMRPFLEAYQHKLNRITVNQRTCPLSCERRLRRRREAGNCNKWKINFQIYWSKSKHVVAWNSKRNNNKNICSSVAKEGFFWWFAPSD